MKLFRKKGILAAAISLSLLAACSNGGGGGTAPANSTSGSNTVSIGVAAPSGQSVIYTATGADSIITGHASKVENKTIIQLCGNVAAAGECTKLMTMTLDGTTAQQYVMTSLDSPSQIVYDDGAGQYASNQGTISVTALGAAGSPVAGTFNATLECLKNCTGPLTVNGSFNVVLGK